MRLLGFKTSVQPCATSSAQWGRQLKCGDVRLTPGSDLLQSELLLWCQAGSRAFGKHIRVPWSHLAPFPRDTEQAGLPIFQHWAVSITVISPQVAFTGQTCLPLCMLPVHVEQHTCFAGLVPWLLHQLSLAADQSRSGAHMHFVPELVTSFELPCCAYTYLSTYLLPTS